MRNMQQYLQMDKIGNIYNRLILFDAKSIHAASEYFGNYKENGRLFQLFFSIYVIKYCLMKYI